MKAGYDLDQRRMQKFSEGGAREAVCPQDLAKGEVQPGVWGRSLQPPKAKGVWGPRPQPPTNFCGFHIKSTHFSTLFY